MPNSEGQLSSYGSGITFIFIYNLIVGTGALALPSSFGDAGWVLSSIILTMICITSFISLSFIIESMSIANFICKSNNFLYRDTALVDSEEDERRSRSSSNSLNNIERTPLINSNHLNDQQNCQLFDITEKIELAHMAKIFFKKEHLKYFYICVIVYLYGDLTIYSTAISKSLRDVTCTFDNCNKTELDSTDLCWQNMNINRGQVYKLYILMIALILPFFNLHTKFLQFLTTLFRWFAFTSMIALASIALTQNKGEGAPVKSNFTKLPNLFGVCVYSFMCHHSISRLITPLKNKAHIYRLISLDYLLVLFFYLLLSLTGIFTFPIVEDVYTLNFQKPRCSSPANLTLDAEPIVPQFQILELFLPLFPVFTLSTNFPILAVTLGNNLKTLLLKETLSNSNDDLSRESIASKLFFPLIVFIPPILVSFLSENVTALVGLTGSYFGVFIQNLIPLYLVYKAREYLNNIENGQEQLSLRSTDNLNNLDNSLSSSIVPRRSLVNKNLFLNQFQSFFKGNFWLYFMFIWSILCLILVSIDNFFQFLQFDFLV